MPEFTDVEVMAYVDGELDAKRVAELRQAADHSQQLRARIETFAASRRILRRGFADAAQRPVPESLRRLLDLPPTAVRTPQPTVSDLRRLPRASARRPVWMLMAAAFVGAVALGLGLQLSPSRDADGLLALALASPALESGRSGVPVRHQDRSGAEVEVLPLATLRVQGGYCREFEVSLADGGGSTARGRACRASDGQWNTVAVSNAEPGVEDDAYQLASGNQATVSADALSETEEQQLLASGWGH